MRLVVVLKLVLTLTLLLALIGGFQGNATAVYAAAGKAAMGLHPLDESPLLGRRPLILVHGINPNPKTKYAWAGFLNHMHGKTAFYERYKLYLFVFDPSKPVPDSGERLKQALHEFLDGEKPEKPLSFAALSLGGLLVQNAMGDAAIEARTERIIGIGVPLHGTPLVSPPWVRAHMKNKSLFSPLRLTNRIVFMLGKLQFPFFESDYCWDNFDGAIPPGVAINSVNCPPRPMRGQEKYILYAGFFNARPEESAWLKQALAVGTPLKALQERRGVWGRHGLFPLAQGAIAGMPLADATDAPADTRATGDAVGDASSLASLMAFNDGISPISSQLWLGRFVKAPPPVSAEALWQAVFNMKGSNSARLFEALDHRDWLEGGTRIKGSSALWDLLHADQPERNVFEWLEYDLMRE